MLSLSQAWGTKFFPTAVEPSALTTMIFASAMNLTGARSLSESAVEQNCPRAAQIARPFADAAQFVQRVYSKHPEYQIVVLGTSGMASHAIVVDGDGEIVFDSYANCRAQYFPNTLYSYSMTGFTQDLKPLASISLHGAYRTLQEEGLWKDNSWSWDVDMPRGTDYL